MTTGQLVRRGLIYYWRTNLAVVLGVATAVAVLAGALLVGDSVRGSLRALVLERLGRTDLALLSSGFFRGQLADDLRAHAEFDTRFEGVAPLIVTQGFVTAQESGRRVGRVFVYGVDERFWRFHDVDMLPGPDDADVLLSPALAEELEVVEGQPVLVRVQRPSAVPLESLHGRKDDLGRTMRLTMRQVLSREDLGEFSLRPQQGDVRAVFVSLERLQRDLEVPGRVNAVLTSIAPAEGVATDDEGDRAALERLVRERVALEDAGLRVRIVDSARAVVVESDAGLLTDVQAAVARAAAAGVDGRSQPVMTYLANTIRSGPREIPYSLIAALDLDAVAPGIVETTPETPVPSLVLNEWAASNLEVEPGAPVTIDYYVWEEPGRLVARSADFRLAAVVPTNGVDRDLAPTYAGITDSQTLDGWDPPFPIDLRRVRPVDEAYWEEFRTTPKAYVPLEAGQRLWRSRYGALTSLRVTPNPGQTAEQVRAQLTAGLLAEVDPFSAGLAVREIRQDALTASRGVTDFGQYFVYFSFFLVVSALLLASLFFKLGVEQRAREVGLLRAVGFNEAHVRRLLLTEGLVLSVAGSVIGLLGALAYAAVMMTGLRTWWVDAVGTTALSVHVTPVSLVGGGLGGVAAAMAWTWWSLRSLGRVSERSLLAGELGEAGAVAGSTTDRARNPWLAVSAATAAVGAALIGAGLLELVARAGAFFGAGASLLVACLTLFAYLFRRAPSRPVAGRGWAAVSSLGLRNAAYRPARSVLSMAVIASATFILISVDAFRRDEQVVNASRQSGVGGYGLMVESLLPVVYDLSTEDGRDALNLGALEGVVIEPFRVLPGDDASCLNLYEPTHPRILGVRDRFVSEGRFDFQSSLGDTEAERANPWRLLDRAEPDGAVPVIADANSLTYVLHKGLGDEIVLDQGGAPVTLRVVAILRDSLFQSELLISERHFQRLYPEQEGYRLLLAEVPSGRLESVQEELEDALADFGADAVPSAQRLAEFHKVENAYLSTFQTLGGLGLLLGTVGLAAVLMRNALERRRELALLGAVGYRRSHFLLMVVAENSLLVGGGLFAGAVCALLAISPAAMERGSRLPLTSGGALLLFGVIVTGLVSSVVATRTAVGGPLLEALRSE